jgi:hypothetical protein
MLAKAGLSGLCKDIMKDRREQTSNVEVERQARHGRCCSRDFWQELPTDCRSMAVMT